MNLIISIFSFILGTSIGSFLSVAIHRIHNNQPGIFLGRSTCGHCKKQLEWTDLIPILSYVMLKGKCRYCDEKLSIHYLFLELSLGLIFLSIVLNFPFINEVTNEVNWQNILHTFFFSIYSTFFIGIFFYDLKYMQIPSIFLFPFIAVTLIGSLFFGEPEISNMIIAFIISLVFFGGQILISKGKWLGGGDLYLAISMAFIFGWKLFLISIVLTYIIGSIISIILMIAAKTDIKSKIAFAPFMILASLITIFYGENILKWYLSLLNFQAL